ncbi:DNA (cytosine-5)-methyltransferase 1 [uncultured Gammaproteobacteria bacterium]
MRGGTLFSGIGAPECAAPGFDWRWAAEIDPFASAVHRTHFPNVPNLGDVTSVDWRGVDHVDCLVFGSPCQSFSVAGRRRGLDDPRGNLALFALGVVDQLRPDWLVFENVQGLLSSNGGRDFEAFLEKMGNIGYGVSWKIFDAQHFGIPQRRRRLFLVGHSGNDWRPPAAVLFERQSLFGHPAPCRQTRKNAAGTAAAGAGSGGGDNDAPLIAFGGNNTSGPIRVATAVNAHGGPCGRLDFESETFIVHTLRGEGFDGSEDGTGRGTPLIPVREERGSRVRRLTPRECERLMALPDDWTLIPWRGRPAPDGRRLKAIGNSMAVPVIRWVLERLVMVDALIGKGGRVPDAPARSRVQLAVSR